MVTPREVKARVAEDPKKAFRTLAPELSRAARKKDPALADQIVGALARHGDTLPAAWRKLLVEMADEPTLASSAAVGLAQVPPHRSMVPPMIRRLEAKLDDEIALAVLAKCADERAVEILIRLLEAPKVAHWDLMLMACSTCGMPELIPALTRWLQRAKKQGVSPKWDGFAEGKQVLAELRHNAR